MTKEKRKKLSQSKCTELISILKARFEKNMTRHKSIEWAKVLIRLESNAEKLWSLNEMEKTGGEPDVVMLSLSDKKTNEYHYCDCSSESPIGRRGLCYDREGLKLRKEFKPENTAIDMAAAMGIELLSEDQYRALQQLGKFDAKTSSWLATPKAIRKLGGSIFGDLRYETVFVCHNSAQS
jgi:hypothetical protein